MRVLALFTRDLRLADNRLLDSGEVTPAFIIDETLLRAHDNVFAQSFLADSLDDLDRQLGRHNSGLALTRGTLKSAFTSLITQYKPELVRLARDITPYAKRRERLIAEICRTQNTTLELVDQHWLLPFKTTTKPDGNPYVVFTPFYRHGNSLEIPRPTTRTVAFTKLRTNQKLLTDLRPKSLSGVHTQTGGRAAAMARLHKPERYAGYNTDRNFPDRESTSQLSAHLHWGTISPREMYRHLAESLGHDHGLIRQLWWREFYGSLAHHFPHIWHHNFRREFDALDWQTAPELLAAWQRGETGFPIVDAAMRCLNATGEMHNRLRLIAASFLVKDLQINWREGEAHFASRLVDFDKTLNNGNWQWVAGSGADAAPYFRIFNPWLQQAKFDPKAHFIKRWCKELAELEPADIHAPAAQRPNYPDPIVDHRAAAQHALAMYAKIRKDT